MDENIQKFLIDTKLAEYRELRAEIRGSMQLQWTILAVFISLFGVVFSLIFKVDSDDLNKVYLQINFIGACFLPGISALCGVLWLDQILRQIRVGTYVYFIEEEVSRIIGTDSTRQTSLNWEHSVKRDNMDSRSSRLKRFFNPNLFYYYIGLGMFIVFPILSWILTFHIVGFHLNCWIILGVIFFLLFLGFSAAQIKSILSSRRYEV